MKNTRKDYFVGLDISSIWRWKLKERHWDFEVANMGRYQIKNLTNQ